MVSIQITDLLMSVIHNIIIIIIINTILYEQPLVINRKLSNKYSRKISFVS